MRDTKTRSNGGLSRIILFMAAHFSHHVLTALLVPLLPLIRDDFGLNYAQSGLVVSAFGLSYGVGNLPAGWLADRSGPRIPLLIGISGVALTGALVGGSSSLAFLFVALLLMGLAGGGYHPSASPLISATVAPENQGRALGFHIVGGGASHFLAPLIGVGIASLIGWRGTYLVLSVPVLAFGVLLFFVLGRAKANGKPTPGKKEAETKATNRAGMLTIVVFMVLGAFYGIFVSTSISFVSLFMVDQFSVTEKTAAVFLSIIYAAGFFAAPLGGFLSDRIGRVRVMVIISLLLGPAIFAMTVVPFGFGFGVLLLIIGTLMFVKMPTVEAFIIESVPLRIRSTILGIYFFSGAEGSALLNPIFGSMVDRSGFSQAFLVMSSVFVGVVLICTLVIAVERKLLAGRYGH